MSDALLAQVEARLDELVRRHRQLEMENLALRQKEEAWSTERTRLIEKNDIARARIEALIGRLQQFETDPE